MQQQIPRGNITPVLYPNAAPSAEFYQRPLSTQGSTSNGLSSTAWNPSAGQVAFAASSAESLSSPYYFQKPALPVYESFPGENSSETSQSVTSSLTSSYFNPQDGPLRSYTSKMPVGPPKIETSRLPPTSLPHVPAPMARAEQSLQDHSRNMFEQRQSRIAPLDDLSGSNQRTNQNSSSGRVLTQPVTTKRSPLSYPAMVVSRYSTSTQNFPPNKNERGFNEKERSESPHTQGYLTASKPLKQPTKQSFSQPWNTLDMQSFPSYPGNADKSSTPSTLPTDASENFTPSHIKTLRPFGSSRIDPRLIPRPQYKGPEEALTEIGGKVYSTDRYIAPPSSLNTFTIVDKGSSSCRFMRMTLGQIPILPETLNSTSVPLSLLVHPFADLGPAEARFPLIDLTHSGVENLGPEDGDGGPIRCLRCRAYINPFMMWEFGQTGCVCNFCNYSFKVPAYYLDLLERAYFSASRDRQSMRHELSFGSVDFVAPEEYTETLGHPPRFCFVIESTYAARSTNVTNCALTALQQIVSSSPHPATEISIITFDETIHFYQLDITKEPPLSNLLVVSDIEEPFSPAPESLLCINIKENREALIDLLQAIPSYLKDISPSHSAGNAALTAAVDLLGKRGCGVVIMLVASIPDVGVGAYYPVKNEGFPFDELQQVSFYRELVKKCQKKGISVDYFCLPIRNTAINLYSMGWITRQTGGKVVYTRDFNWIRDYDKFYYDIHRALFRPAGFDVTLKLRCSKGLSVKHLYSSFQGQDIIYNFSNFKLARLDGDTALSFDLKMDEALTDCKHAFFQCACLYTHFSGKRYIRVHTLALPVASSLSATFRYADIDAVVSLFLRRAALDVLKGKSSWKDTLITSVMDILFAYRYNCTPTDTVGALLLPETLKLLPIYASAITKHVAIRGGCSRDERIWHLFNFLSLPPAHALILLYPRVFPIHRSFSRRAAEIANSATIGKSTIDLPQFVYLPESIPAKGDCLTTDGVYLFDCGNLVLLYVGADVSPTYISQLLDETKSPSSSVTAEVPSSSSFVLKTQPEDCAGAMVNRMIQQIRLERKSLGFPQFKLVFPGTLDEEIVYSALVEDSVGAMPTYVELLSQLHLSIKAKYEET